MTMNARDYRKSAQAHAIKALKLMAGEPGLSPAEQAGRLEHAVGHLASAMAHASAARALAVDALAPAPIDITAATDEMVTGLEAMLAEES